MIERAILVIGGAAVSAIGVGAAAAIVFVVVGDGIGAVVGGAAAIFFARLQHALWKQMLLLSRLL